MSDEKNNIHRGDNYNQRDNQGTIVMGDLHNHYHYYKESLKENPLSKYINFKVRYTKNNVFGRGDDIQRLYDLLFKEKQVVLMNSIGGIGKTTTALYYAGEYESQYQHLIGLEGGKDLEDFLKNDTALHTNLRAEQQVIAYTKHNQQAYILPFIEMILLGLPEPTLFIIDDANEKAFQTVQRWNANHPQHHFLFTSRQKNDVFKLYELNYLNDAAALQVFYTHTPTLCQTKDFTLKKQDYDTALLAVFRLIHNHTLAVEILAKTFEAERSDNMLAFCTKYTKVFLPFLEKYPIQKGLNTPDAFGRDILLRLFDISNLHTHPAALYALTQISALPSKDLAVNILAQLILTDKPNWKQKIAAFLLSFLGQPHIKQAFASKLYTIEDLKITLRYLQQRGWLTSNTDRPFNYDCHPLIQEAVRAQQNTTDDTYAPLVQKIRNILAKNNKNRFWENKPYLPYAVSIEQLLSQENKLQAYLCNEIGYYYDDMNDFEKALYYYQKALDIREKVLGIEHTDTANSYNNIGVLYKRKGDSGSALDYCKKALAIQEKVLGKEHRDTAASYNNIGNLYSQKGDFEKALNYYQKALTILEKVLGTEHTDTAKSYNNIGLLYKQKGDLEATLNYYQKALAIREKVLGTEHTATAVSYNNIGLLYSKKDDLDTALDYYQKALDILEKVLGTEHTDTAQSYNNIGDLHHQKGDLDSALDYYQKALAIQEKVLGTEHTNTALSYNNIANLYYKKGNFDTALNFIQKAYNIFKNKLGDEHPDTKNSYEGLQAIQAAIQEREHDKNQ